MRLAFFVLLPLHLLAGPLCPDPVQAQPLPGDVVINEIHYAPTPSNNEFIELYNRSQRTIDVQTLSFADARSEAIAVTGEGLLLPPGGYLVVVRDAPAFQAAFPDVDFTRPSDWPALNNGGDTISLWMNGTLVDRVPYTPDWSNQEGASLERIDPAGPSEAASNFASSTAPAGATPGAQNSQYAPDETPPALVFAEVMAARIVDVYFDEPIAADTPPAAFRTGAGQTATALSLSDGARVRATFAAPVMALRLQVASVRDRTGNVRNEGQTFLAYAPEPGDIALNEVLFDPLADDFDARPNQPEYFELVNRTDRALSLHRAYWTDRPDESGMADTTHLPAARLAVPPDAYAVVFAAPDAAGPGEAAAFLARAFPRVDTTAMGPVLFPIDATQLGLRNDGDAIRLHRAGGTLVAAVQYAPAWHAPQRADTKGIALERVSLSAAPDAASNWTSSVAPAGGTPGRANSVHLAATPPAETALTVAPSPFSPDGDGRDDATRLRFSLPTAAATVRVRIFDAYGRRVRTLTQAQPVGSTGELIWDGRGDAGRRLRIGIYVILFEALDAQGARVTTLKRPVVLARPLH